MSEPMNTDLAYWLNEIDDAKKRDEDYVRDGDRILDIYSCKDEKKVPFNVLFSNTDTLLPALFSSTPRPVVQRRFKDDDPIGKAAAMAGTRMLEYLIDTNIDGYETFTEGVQKAVIDALLPGRGITAVKYDAEINEEDTDNEEQETDDTEEDATETGPLLEKESELVCIDAKEWDRVLFGYSKKWSTTPWIAFEQSIDKPEAIRLFGKKIANKIQYTKDNDQPDDDKTEGDEENQGGRKTAGIYQIWDKANGRKVRYVSRHYKDGFLKVEDDPLELTGFYPIPKPLCIVAQSVDNAPIASYLFYETQAKELNELTRRITLLAKAIKAKGIYDAELGDDIANMMDGDDNSLMPADKSSAIAAEKGFQNAIWFMPVEQLIKVLRELYTAREQCKQVIYEITGISDIIRGSTNANETATAQNIKSQWGTMRLQRMQGEVQRYARDILRIMLEMAASKFSESTWAKMTGLPFATEEQVAQAQAIVQASQSKPNPFSISNPVGSPTQQSQTSPIVQQAKQTLQAPRWSQVLELLRNDIDRSYRIDIETNSTVLPQLQEDQQNMAQVLDALSKYLQGVTPLIQAGAFPFEAAKAMMMSVVRRFQFGQEIEDYIKEMKQPEPPAPPQDNTLQIKQMETQAQQQSEEKNAQLTLQVEKGKAATQMRLEEMKNNTDIKKHAMTLNASKREADAMQFDENGEEIMGPTQMEQMMALLENAQQQNLQAQQAQTQQIGAMIAAMTETLAAPKIIVRDDSGRAVGVKSIYGQN